MGIAKHKMSQAAEDFKRAETISRIEQSLFKELEKAEYVPHLEPYTQLGQENRTAFLENKLNTSIDYVKGKKVFEDHSQLQGNIENFIGMTQIPTGVVGPLLVNGSAAKGDFYIPLATTEGALVASYGRQT